MGVQHSQDSAYSKEARRWESTHTELGPPLKPPYVYQRFPAMLYKGVRTNGVLTFESIQVGDETEERNMQSRGFVAGGKGEALKALDAAELEVAKAAANRVYNERGMSEQAKTEAAAVDDSTDSHVPEIFETPIRRGPGRPPNAR